MRALWDQIDATAVFSIQLYESYKHFYVLNRYLEAIDYRAITPGEIAAIRERNLDLVVTDPAAELARYMISEHFAAYFFLRVSRQAAEPVLRDISRFIAQDEFRHTQFAADLLEARLAAEPEAARTILQAAVDFTHVGSEVVGRVPVSEKNDLGAILSLNKRLRRLCGVSLSDFSKGLVHGAN